MIVTWKDIYETAGEQSFSEKLEKSLGRGTFVEDLNMLATSAGVEGWKTFIEDVSKKAYAWLSRMGYATNCSITEAISLAYKNHLLDTELQTVVRQFNMHLFLSVTAYDMPTLKWLKMYCKTIDRKRGGTDFYTNLMNMKSIRGNDLCALQQDVDEMESYIYV